MTRPIKWRLKHDYDGWTIQYKLLWWWENFDTDGYLTNYQDAKATLEFQQKQNEQRRLDDEIRRKTFAEWKKTEKKKRKNAGKKYYYPPLPEIIDE